MQRKWIMSQLVTVPAVGRREFRAERLEGDIVVVGGGLAGTCAAVTAARAGARVVLVQDRPVLGGNASSEVRLWVQGAVSHGQVNNRWAREGGVVDEILVENTFRNREGNAVVFDTVLLDLVRNEPNITLLLNTSVAEVSKADERITAVHALGGQNQTRYEITAPLFCDASGDGVLGYLAGAAFRMGAESREEFGEGFAPSAAYGSLLPHSLFFYSKDTGKPVRYVPPSFAMQNVARMPRYRNFTAGEHGAQLWWLDHGGRLDTIHDSERIKWELWAIVHGIWNHLKNSGEFPEADPLTLEWVGTISGKRESRRFEGHYMLCQADIIEQREHDDAVSYGGWAIDLHPSDGVFSEHPAANLMWARGLYQIPYRCLVSRDVLNLFLAGRIISATHVALGSTRVMGTCAHMGQAVGMAAALCTRDGVDPVDLLAPDRMRSLRTALLRTGQHIPGACLADPDDLVRQAAISASSEYVLHELPPDGPALPLDRSRAQLLPVPGGPLPELRLTVDVTASTTLRIEARTGNRPDDHTPDAVVAATDIELVAGSDQKLTIQLDGRTEQPCYVFVCFLQNEDVAVRASTHRATGLLSVRHGNTQERDDVLGRPHLEFWYPERRPAGHNLAVTLDPPLRPYAAANVTNGVARPNAWVADPADPLPALDLRWPVEQQIGTIRLTFDTDPDHHLESVLRGHPESVMPFCVRHYRIRAGDRTVAEITDNHQTREVHRFNPPLLTEHLTVEILAVHGDLPAALFEIACYDQPEEKL
jgi:hypothetical protein